MMYEAHEVDAGERLQRATSQATTARATGAADTAAARAVLALQRRAGNAAVSSWMRPRIRPHIVVQRSPCCDACAAGQPCQAEDHERQADEVAGTAAESVQRHATAVQRVGDFVIGGAEQSPGDTMNVYFDRNSNAVSATEQPKIAKIVTAVGAGTALVLDGYASEDEAPALAGQRATNVSTALGAAAPPHTGARTKRDQSARGQGRIDYRSVRKVEVQGTVVGVPLPPPKAPASINRPCGAALTNAKPRALTLLTNAITALAGAPAPAVKTLIGDLFGGASGVAAKGTIHTQLVALKNHINTEIGPAGTVACHTLLDARCNNPAYNVGVGPTAVMTLCPDYLDNPGSIEQNAATLIHEAGHGTTGLETKDLAYGHTRLIRALPTAQALKNTDSYVLLVRNINAHLAGTPAVPIGVAGDAQPGMSVPEKRTATRALAHAEKWLTQSYQDVLSVYTTVHDSIGAGAWTGTTAAFDRETMHRLAATFALTDPGVAAPFAMPTAADKEKLAAIHDRFLAMRSVMWSKGITMTKGAAPEAWAPGPGASVTLTAAFFALADDTARAKRLIELLAGAHPDISAGFRAKYVAGADAIRQHRGLGP